MKTIRRYFNNAQAEFERSLLVSVGIAATLADANVNTVGPGYASWGVRLQVPDGDVARALEILGGGSEEFAPLPDDFVPPDVVPDEAGTAPSQAGLGKLGDMGKACLLALVVFGVAYALFMRFAPLTWHSRAELMRMGMAAGKSGNYERAIQCYNAVLLINAGDAAAYYDRGLAYAEETEYEKAINDFLQVIKFNPESAPTFSMLGNAYERIGKYDEALDCLNKAVRIDPRHYRAYFHRGTVYSKMGDFDKAIEDYKQAQFFAPSDYWYPINDMAWLYATYPDEKKRDGTRAMGLAKKACGLSEWKDCYCIGTLAAAEAETGDFDDAVKHGQQALAMAREDKRIDKKMLDEMAEALAGYQQGKPYRDVAR